MTVGSSVVIGRVVAGVVIIVDDGATVVTGFASLFKVDTTFRHQWKINNLY
jgi:hypothetical protein